MLIHWLTSLTSARQFWSKCCPYCGDQLALEPVQQDEHGLSRISIWFCLISKSWNLVTILDDWVLMVFSRSNSIDKQCDGVRVPDQFLYQNSIPRDVCVIPYFRSVSKKLTGINQNKKSFLERVIENILFWKPKTLLTAAVTITFELHGLVPSRVALLGVWLSLTNRSVRLVN